MNLSTVKICVLGAENVGKTALVVRFVTKRYIGLYQSKKEKLYRRRFSCSYGLINLDILDTINQNEEHRYCNWADCAVFVYAINDRDTFDRISHLHHSLVKSNGSVTSLLLGNKADLVNGRKVLYSEGAELGEKLGCQFYEISVADGNQIGFIDEIFCGLVRHHMLRRQSSGDKSNGGSSKFKRVLAKVINSHMKRINSI